MRKIFTPIFIAIGFIACKSEHTTVIIYSKGPAEVNSETKTITTKDGTGHEEKVIELAGKGFSYQLNAPLGEAKLDFNEPGLYIVNAKKDTVVGCLQNFVASTNTSKKITQEDLTKKIDSLVLLTEGKNISAANHNFYLLPNQVQKITTNTDALIISPYHRMRSAEAKDGKAPEVYRFYSIKEIRETIAELKEFQKPIKQ